MKPWISTVLAGIGLDLLGHVEVRPDRIDQLSERQPRRILGGRGMREVPRRQSRAPPPARAGQAAHPASLRTAAQGFPRPPPGRRVSAGSSPASAPRSTTTGHDQWLQRADGKGIGGHAGPDRRAVARRRRPRRGRGRRRRSHRRAMTLPIPAGRWPGSSRGARRGRAWWRSRACARASRCTSTRTGRAPRRSPRSTRMSPRTSSASPSKLKMPSRTALGKTACVSGEHVQLPVQRRQVRHALGPHEHGGERLDLHACGRSRSSPSSSAGRGRSRGRRRSAWNAGRRPP